MLQPMMMNSDDRGNFICEASTGYAAMQGAASGAVSSSALTTAVSDSIAASSEGLADTPGDGIAVAPGKYPVEQIADWFLDKKEMAIRKLQELCYYAQAWFYTLKGIRLINTEFEARIEGPVSPVLDEKFGSYGTKKIKKMKPYVIKIEEDDLELLEDVYETYGDKSGLALCALSQREPPWIQARNGYAPSEKCSVPVSPEDMKSYYSEIYKK